MAMAIMAVIMGIISNITAISLIVLGSAVVAFCMRPAPQDSVQQIAYAQTLPLSQKLAILSDVRDQQTTALAARPADAYGWVRLAYLRRATHGAESGAIAMSKEVAPFEPALRYDRARLCDSCAQSQGRVSTPTGK